MKKNKRKQQRPELYEDRAKVLETLGFSSYQEYLESDLWKTIRKLVFRRDNYRCVVKSCLSRGKFEAHHVSYSLPVMAGFNPGAIVTLCNKHHRFVEYTSRFGKKLMLANVQQKTLRLIKVRSKVEDWLKYQAKNQQHIAERVLILLRPTDYYGKIASLVSSGEIDSFYVSSLKIWKGTK